MLLVELPESAGSLIFIVLVRIKTAIGDERAGV